MLEVPRKVLKDEAVDVHRQDGHEGPELCRVQQLQVHEVEGDAQQQLPKGLAEQEVEGDGAQLLAAGGGLKDRLQ